MLLGDSEMAEGSQWEALQAAAHYRLGNLIGILVVNRLGQRGETMYGHDVEAYESRISSFDWKTVVVDVKAGEHKLRVRITCVTNNHAMNLEKIVLVPAR